MKTLHGTNLTLVSRFFVCALPGQMIAKRDEHKRYQHSHQWSQGEQCLGSPLC